MDVDEPPSAAAPEPAVERGERSKDLSASSWLIGVLVLSFLVQQGMMSSAGFASSSVISKGDMLFAVGALDRDAIVSERELSRLLVAPLLHQSAIHFFTEQFWLAFTVSQLQKLLRPSTIFVLCFCTALGGSLGGLLYSPPAAVPCGAGAISIGLGVTSLVLSFRFASGEVSASLRRRALLMLGLWSVPLLLTRLLPGLPLPDDLGMALGGAVVGAMFAELLTQLKKRKVSDEGVQTVMRKITTGFVIALGLSLCVTALRSETYVERFKLYKAGFTLPTGVIPADREKAKREVDNWGKGHETDPRVRHIRAIQMLEAGELASAESELRNLLSERIRFENIIGNNSLELSLRTTLCQVLLEQGRLSEAREEARMVCAQGSPLDQSTLREFGVCD